MPAVLQASMTASRGGAVIFWAVNCECLHLGIPVSSSSAMPDHFVCGDEVFSVRFCLEIRLELSAEFFTKPIMGHCCCSPKWQKVRPIMCLATY